MKRYLAALVFLVASAASAAWYDDYHAGVDAVRRGEWQKVVTKMTAAIAAMPRDRDNQRTYGAIFISYHPYYYRGIAYANLGRNSEAIADLERATGPGEIDLGSVDTWLKRLGATATARPPAPTSVPAPVPPPTTAPRPVPSEHVDRAHAPAPMPKPKSMPSTATTAVLPPPAKTSPASPYPADVELLALGSIAFNTPPQMTTGEPKVIQLLLDPSRTPGQLVQKITENGKTETAVVRISKTVEAKLSGTTFDIRAITPETQPISGTDTTEWRWEVTPREAGTHRLFLTINAVLGSDPARRTVRTYDHAIEVRVSPATIAARYSAIAIALIAAAGIAFVANKRLRRGAIDSQATTVQRSAGRAATFEPGQLVAGRYRIVRFLGRGGMGAVYEAEDLELNNERIAIKTILASSADPERALARLRREIQVARRVAHPNVCRVFDVGFQDGSLFVTMEYIEGRTLSDIIRERSRLDPTEAVAVVGGLAAALDATHRAGLIHRDVKSANVMIAARDGRAVLMDFGLARAAADDPAGTSITQTGAIVGSPMYMAPEQMQDAKLTPATDVYAFGVVMYEMVTGHLPFEGDSAISVLARRLREPPPPPSQFVEGLDPRWERAILKCLDPEPAQRFQTASEVFDAIGGRREMTTQIM